MSDLDKRKISEESRKKISEAKNSKLNKGNKISDVCKQRSSKSLDEDPIIDRTTGDDMTHIITPDNGEVIRAIIDVSLILGEGYEYQFDGTLCWRLDVGWVTYNEEVGVKILIDDNCENSLNRIQYLALLGLGATEGLASLDKNINYLPN